MYKLTNFPQKGMAVWYIDGKGKPEKGTVFSVDIVNGVLGTFSVNFDDDFYEFTGHAWGSCIFNNPEGKMIENKIEYKGKQLTVTEILDKLENTEKLLSLAMKYIPKNCSTCRYGKSPCDWCIHDPDQNDNWEWKEYQEEK